MLLHCFVALLAWSSVSASKYCMPSKYEVSAGVYGVREQGFVSYVCRASFDYNKGLTNSDCLMSVPYSAHERIIEDLRAKKIYIIDVKKGTCMQLSRPMGPDQCIQGGKVILNSYLGNGTLPFTSFSRSFPGGQVYVSVTPGSNGTFIPVSTSITNYGGFKFENIGYYGYSDGIKDPSVFTIPQACHKTTQSEQKDEKARTEIEDFNRIRISFL